MTCGVCARVQARRGAMVTVLLVAHRGMRRPLSKPGSATSVLSAVQNLLQVASSPPLPHAALRG
jgi:hypothetical protein